MAGFHAEARPSAGGCGGQGKSFGSASAGGLGAVSASGVHGVPCGTLGWRHLYRALLLSESDLLCLSPA